MRAHYGITCIRRQTISKWKGVGEKGVSKTGGKQEETRDQEFSWAFWKDESGAGDAGHVVACAHLIDCLCLAFSLSLSPPLVCLFDPTQTIVQLA